MQDGYICLSLTLENAAKSKLIVKNGRVPNQNQRLCDELEDAPYILLDQKSFEEDVKYCYFYL